MLMLSRPTENILAHSTSTLANSLMPAEFPDKKADLSVMDLAVIKCIRDGRVATYSRSWLGRSSQYDLVSLTWLVAKLAE